MSDAIEAFPGAQGALPFTAYPEIVRVAESKKPIDVVFVQGGRLSRAG